ncbi:MAG: TRZ/ATZ family protein [Ruminococcaceae bacterium]|nr:TRZ/ATZ family protein [Oscillospiraceae bacterium]
MQTHYINTEEFELKKADIRAGDSVLISGTVYTARDAAHKRLFELLDSGKELPFDLKGAFIYYAGPTLAAPGKVIGSCGPTTSVRMDGFTPRLLDLGLGAVIGKGGRKDDVRESFLKNDAVYFAAVGGAGALYSECITSCEVIAFEELGCESVKKLTVKDMPVYCAYDIYGNSIYDRK